MKAAQITQYSKNIRMTVNDIPVPEIGDDDILIRVKAAAVNPVDILNLTGAVRLIQDYKMPRTLGNECAGIVEKAGRHVTRFQPGDRVYSRLPVSSLGAFAEYVAVPALAAVGILRVVVQIAHHHLQIAFEQACAQRDEQQRRNHENHRHDDAAIVDAAHGNSQQHITQKHNENADGYTFTVTDFVGKNATDQRQEID